jgi:hypothetical protein
MIRFYNHTLKQIWKNMIIVKPKIVGDFMAQDLTRMVANEHEMNQVLDDIFLKLKVRGTIEGKL